MRLVIGTLLALLALSSVPKAWASLRPQERALLTAVNEVRTARGLRPLRVDATLVRAARTHSNTLIDRDVFEHGPFLSRLARFGAQGPTFGENLAWAAGPSATAQAILGAWLASPSHRSNLLRPGWRRVGIGVRVGTFSGYRGATVVTADFAGS